MPAHVSTHPNRGNAFHPKSKRPWRYAFTVGKRVPMDACHDSWTRKDLIRRVELLRAAYGDDREASLAALEALAREYHGLRLPMVEAHWKRLEARGKAQNGKTAGKGAGDNGRARKAPSRPSER